MARRGPDAVRKYATDVLAGRIVAGEKVRAACRRHLADLRDGPKRGLRWDRHAAEHALEFFPSWLRLAEGQFDGQPFALQPWQQFIVGSIFGWRLVDGTRRFRTAYIECGKGNGKTPIAAGIGLLGLVADNEPAAEIYTAGVTRDQANYILADGQKMVAKSPALRARVEASVHNLAVIATASYMRSVSSEARSLDQRRVHMALIDEIHEHPTDQVVDKMRAGTKGRRNALIFEITNSGYDRHSICWRHHDYSAKILAGAIENDAWFAMLFELDEGDEWTDERAWPKANPNLGVSVPLRYLREQVAEALGMPAQQSIVRRLNFCVWTEASRGAIDLPAWDRGATPPQIAPGDEVYAARDLSQQPVGPRPNAIPLLIGGNGPKGQRHAALHADIWSGYAEERAHVDELGPRLASLDAICEEIGRDPAAIGRGVGISIRPLEPAGFRPDVVSGSAEEMAEAIRSFREAGFTQVDLMLGPGTVEAFDAMAPVLELVRAD